VDWRPNIYSYTSYRAFLGDYYRAAKENMPVFSYRYFSRRAGFSSPNFLKLVIDGKRNLGPDSIGRFARALKLERPERRFFSLLVAFEQAGGPEERNAAFQRLVVTRRFRLARRLDTSFWEYLSTWYYPAVRELVGRSDFVEDPEWIAGQLVPPISPDEAGAALETLKKLELLVRDDEGRLVRKDVSLTTGHDVRSLAVGNYHRQMLARAAESIELVDSEYRELGALTVCVSRETAVELKRRVQAFRESLLDLCDADPDPEVVYQVNMQLFPLTQPEMRPGTPRRTRTPRV